MTFNIFRFFFHFSCLHFIYMFILYYFMYVFLCCETCVLSNYLLLNNKICSKLTTPMLQNMHRTSDELWPITIKRLLKGVGLGNPEIFPSINFFLNLHHGIVMSKYIFGKSFKKFHRTVFSIAHPKYSNFGGIPDARW